MGKKKKKQQQQLPAFSARKPQVPERPTLLQLTGKGKHVFQKPEAQGAVPELTDDTSPNITMKKGQGANKTGPQKLTTLKDNWNKFQETLKKKDGQTFQNTFVEAHAHIPLPPTPDDVKPSSSGTKEITWELNPIDDKDMPKEINKISGKDPAKPEVVKGKASEIKLFIQPKDKPVVVNKPSAGSIISDRIFNNDKNKATKSRLSSVPTNRHGGVLGQPAFAYPKGIPRSFLANQANPSSIEPQDQKTPPENKNAPTPTLPWPAPAAAPKQPAPAPAPPLQPPPLSVRTSPARDDEEKQQYSPSEVYDSLNTELEEEDPESPDAHSGLKRLSAFQRLGPLSQPKKPKLTINLLCNKDESVREVVNQNQSIEEEEKFTPVHLRKDMRDSNDELVLKYLPHWPWRRNVSMRKSVTARSSKSVMILEQEQMEEAYEKDNMFIAVTVRGYPTSWRKEHILDAVLDSVKGKSFIPCFIEFKQDECKFLVIKCRSALLAIHKLGFFIRKDDVELGVTISLSDLSLKILDFIPRLILRKLLASGYDGERKLSLKEFTIGNDVSHFIYFPLSRLTNQSELVQIQSTIAWNYITDLDLSHNKITSIDGFELPVTTPRLKHLDLSHNSLQKVTALLRNRELSLRSLKLEGNPLCHDYIDPGHYVRVVKMIFTGLVELDGIPIQLKDELPPTRRNYCPDREAKDVVNKFLDVFFPLLEAPLDERARIVDLYDKDAVLTVTYRYSLRYSALHRKFRNIFLLARVLAEGDTEAVRGAADIARLLAKWPALSHDPTTFTVDVILHTENHTILKIGGILKLTAETLADDEHLVAFTRNVVLSTEDGVEYKITNEMVYWDEPCKEMADIAFQLNSIKSLKQPIKLDVTNPDTELKEQLVEIFTHITNLEKPASERCLEAKEWNLKSALEHFMKLVKLDDLDSLRVDSPKLA